MEGGPKQKHSAEVIQFSDWKELRDQAPEQAAAAIAAIEGFAEMDAESQIGELNALFQQLESEGNENRFVARHVTEHIQTIEESLQQQADEVTAQRQERMQMPNTPPDDYLGKYQVVSAAEKQPLSPAANDNRSPQALAG